MLSGFQAFQDVWDGEPIDWQLPSSWPKKKENPKFHVLRQVSIPSALIPLTFFCHLAPCLGYSTSLALAVDPRIVFMSRGEGGSPRDLCPPADTGSLASPWLY